MDFAAEKMSRQILHVTIQHVLYPITESVLHQVFDPYGVVETIEIFPGRSRIVAFIKYGLDHDASRAFENLQGRNIYHGCCQLCIELLPVSPGSGATKLKEMTQQTTIKIEAPRKEAEAKVQQGPEAAAEAHEEAASEEEAASVEEAEATQIPISAERTVGAAKRITAELPGAAEKLVATVLQPGITITKPQIEVRLAATIGEPPTASDLAAATQPEVAHVVALGTIEVTLDVPRHGAVGATRPWLSACSLRTSCLSGRGVVLWTVAHYLPMRLREGVG
jgi:hypothetical protein